MDKIDKLKNILKILRNDTITPKQVEEFLVFVLKTIKDSKDDFDKTSKANVLLLRNVLDNVEQTKKALVIEFNQNYEDKSRKTTKEFDSKIEKIESLLQQVKDIKAIPGKDGADGKDVDQEAVILEVIRRVKLTEKEPETAGQIRDKLMSLEGDDRISASAIKDLPVPSNGRGFGSMMKEAPKDNIFYARYNRTWVDSRTFTEESTPSTPSANKIKLYAKDDGSGTTALFTLDSSGIETQLGAGGSGGATTLDGLTDVVITSPASGNVLRYSGTEWVNTQLAHSDLSGVGTNTHTQIDSHIANTSNPHSVTVSQIGAVATTGNETIAGTKTFSTLPQSSVVPSSGNDLVNKTYADGLAQGFRFKAACNVASTANLTLSGEQTIDGVLTSSSRILVKNQTTGAENGVYITGAGAWTRATDYDQDAEVLQGTAFLILGGTTNAATQWALSTTGAVVGTTALVFIQISAPITYTASLGVELVGSDFRADLLATGALGLTGNELKVNVDSSSIEISANALQVKALGITNAMLAGSIANSKLDTIGISKGGTNITTYTTGDILYASAADTLSKLPISTNGYVLTLAGGLPSWAAPTGGGGAGVNSLTYSKSLETSISTATISNSTTETTIYSYTVAGNTLSTNKILKVIVSGTYLNNSGANRTVTIRFKYGATTLISRATGVLATSATTGNFTYTFYLMAHGATNVQEAYMLGFHETGTGNPVTVVDGGTSAEDSTGSLSLTVTAQLSAATATQTFTKRFATINMENASDTVGSPSDAQYVVLSANSDLSAERVLTGTSNQVTVTDNGAGSTVVLSLPQSIATTSSPRFTALALGKAASGFRRLDLIVDGGGTYSQGIGVEATNSTDPVLGSYVTGDAFLRFDFQASGLMEWGGGVGVVDTNLYRSAANMLKTDDSLTIATQLLLGTADIMTVHGAVITSQLEINSDTLAISEVHTHSNTAGSGSVYYGARSRGTTATPLIVQSGDTAMLIAAVAYDGVDYEQVGYTSFQIDGTPGSNDMPGRWILATTADGAFTPTERMRVTSNGFVGIGMTPAAVLNIGGNFSSAQWATSGIGFAIAAATYTDTSSSGTVATQGVHAIGVPTLVASSSTTYTDSATWYLAGAPTASTNVTQTRAWVIYSPANHKSYHAGDLYIGTGKSNSLTMDNVKLNIQESITDPTGANTAVGSRHVTTLTSGNAQSQYAGYFREQVDQAGQTHSGNPVSVQASSTIFGSSGTVNNLYGFKGDVRNTGAGTLTTGIVFSASAGINSGGGTFTNFIGYDVVDGSVGSTLIAGYRGQITSGSGKYNLYMSGSAANYLAGTLELGHLTDTTISRSAAGVIAVEGVVIPSISSTNTLSNKRITRRVYTAANNTSLTPEIDTYDVFHLTAMSGATTINNHSTSTPTDGEMMLIRFLDNGTARALTWGSNYVAKAGTALPTTTTLSKNLVCLFEWNANLSKWNLLSAGLEA